METGTVMMTSRKVFFYSLQEIGIVQDVGIVVGTDAIIGLGSKIVALLPANR